MKKKIMIFSLLGMLGLSLVSPVVNTAQAYGPTQPPIDYTQTRLVSTRYITNSQLQTAVYQMNRGVRVANALSLINVPMQIVNVLASNQASYFSDLASMGYSLKVETYEKVNWDGYSARHIIRYYAY